GIVFVPRYPAHRHLHSFPTRRSSDFHVGHGGDPGAADRPVDPAYVVGAHAAGPDDGDAQGFAPVHGSRLPVGRQAPQERRNLRVRTAIGSGLSGSQGYMSCSTMANRSTPSFCAATRTGSSSGTPPGGSHMTPRCTAGPKGISFLTTSARMSGSTCLRCR